MTRPSVGRSTRSLLVTLPFVFANDALAAARYTIGGHVAGLGTNQSVTLLNNGGNALTRTGNGPFVFSTPVAAGEIYTVTVGAHPSGQKCSVTNGAAGVANANVTDVAVTCANKYSIGGSITGLGAGKRVTLLNNGVNALTRTVNGSFVFSTVVAAGGRYTVTVGTQPSGQVCTVANGSLLLGNANVTNVAVTCVNNRFSIGGTIVGLAPGKSVKLLNNGGNALTRTVDGSFAFSTLVASGGKYTVTVGTQPIGQKCSVANGSFLLGNANVTNVAVTCVNKYSIGGTITGLAPGKSVTLLNNGGNALTRQVNGPFVFRTPVGSGGKYTVTVGTQPSAQKCSVANGTILLANANVTNVSVSCRDTPTYSLTDLGTLGGTFSQGLAINDSGQVTGHSSIVGDTAYHAFVTRNDVMIDLGTLGGTQSVGNAINASGQVTGSANTIGDMAYHAFLANNGVMTDLGTLGGRYSEGVAINPSGQVAGYSTTSDDGGARQRAFITINGVMTDLGTLGGTDSYGSAINASGQVAGGAATTGNAAGHAFVTINGVMTDLGTLGGTNSDGTAINASGQVTGDADTNGNAARHAFVAHNGVMTDLGTLGGTLSYGTAINDSGQVTGYSHAIDDYTGARLHAFIAINDVMTDLGTLGGRNSVGLAINDSGQVTGHSTAIDDTGGDGNSHAFLYSDGQMLDLNDLVDASSPLAQLVVLTVGMAITDTGFILANGYNVRTGEEHAYLLSPVSP